LAWASVTSGFSRASRLEPEADEARRARVQRHRHHDLGTGPQELERRWQHTDHLTWPAIDHECPADDAIRATEPSLPIPVGQNHSQGIPRRVVFGAEEPTENGLHPQQR
jgi:hypothetical protein